MRPQKEKTIKKDGAPEIIVVINDTGYSTLEVGVNTTDINAPIGFLEELCYNSGINKLAEERHPINENTFNIIFSLVENRLFKIIYEERIVDLINAWRYYPPSD